MDLNHLHLHVRDIPRARKFYETYFEFEHEVLIEEGFLIVRNADGFDLAFMQDQHPAPFPEWFHFGFRLPNRDAVEALHNRMVADRVEVPRPVEDHGSWISFRCADPDGLSIEVYFNKGQRGSRRQADRVPVAAESR